MFHVVLVRSGPDWEPGRPLEKQSGWDEHAAFMDGLVDDGFIVLGGPLADEHRVVHVVDAESEGVVRGDARRDRGARPISWWTPSTRGRSGSTAVPSNRRPADTAGAS